jgi:formylglycine-generating enzyme required for sulfatase activity/energy-coupling factor transporter ATP-binding protein EcfA2
MIWEILLTATIETGLGFLTEVGFGDASRDLRDRLFKTDEKKRRNALEKAFAKASAAASDESLEPLLVHRPFQEEVIKALLDPVVGFDVRSLAQFWGDRFPEHVIPLRRFFNTLQNTLLADEVWGEILERYQSLRFRQDVQKALQERKLPLSDAPVVRALSAKLEGEGAIAQGQGSVAVGARGVYVGGNVHQIVQITIQQFLGTNEIETGDARQRYLSFVAAQANLLPWTQVTTQNADPGQGENLRLADVYINLDTTELRHMEREEQLREYLAHQSEAQRIPAQEIVGSERFLLMMGDPGSGKSTFIKHLAYLLAQANLAEDPTVWLAQLTHWEHGPFLPVRVELRHLAAFADANQGVGKAKLLLGFIQKEFKDWGMDDFWKVFITKLQSAEGKILFMLDGLDEVPTSQRQLVVSAVNDLHSLYESHRFIVTCRPYAYVGQPWRLTRFHEVTLAPFSEEQINGFIQNWYEQLAQRGRLDTQAQASEKARRLKEAVRRRDLIGLAERPLLLTVMAQLHAYTGQLPEDRTQLYSDAVQLLLQRWEGRLEKELGLLEYLNVPGLKMSDLEEGLYKVAFNAHARSASLEGTADIKEGDLVHWLKPYLGGSLDKAEQFVKYIRERAGLLIRHKTEAYTFPHRSFQEFLTACHWLTLSDYPGESYGMIEADMDRWREVFILAAGYAARTKRLSQAIASVNALLPGSLAETPVPSLKNYGQAILAGQTLLEIGMVGVQRDHTGAIVLFRVRDWLVDAITQDHVLTPKDRAEAGRVLAKLGDPRVEVVDVNALPFCFVAAGKFIMGEDKEKKSLPNYWVGKYPVTNAQFRQFVDAGGYGKVELWAEAIEAGYWKDGAFKGLGDDEPRDRPVDFGEPYALENHPVVGISWYEALAFARWLDTFFKERASEMLTKARSEEDKALWKGIVSNRLYVTLPTESEWEKAARGVDGRQYPWGSDAVPNLANYRDTGIDTTSAVGCFPHGRSVNKAEEMSGNVWEWTRSLESWAPVLRGGSFGFESGNVRCAFRASSNPDNGFKDFGFRIVVSPNASLEP